jgi:hypothetical protein
MTQVIESRTTEHSVQPNIQDAVLNHARRERHAIATIAIERSIANYFAAPRA